MYKGMMIMERKFIPTKKDQFEKYLERIEKISDENLNSYLDGSYQVNVDRISGKVPITLVRVVGENLENYIHPKGFVEVTNMEVFADDRILSGSIISNNTIIEGTDGVGKSVSIEQLLKMGIICQDRSIEVVSKNMFFDIPMEVRAKEIEDYLIKGDKYIIFLVNNCQKDLEDRINKREVISEYDLEAYRYNGLYLDTFNYMQEHDMIHGKLFLVDCTHLTVDEQVQKILDVMRKYQTPTKDVKLRTLKY